MTRASRLIGIVAGVAVALAAAVILVLSATNTTRFIPVLSNSMAPELPVGSLAIASPVARSEVRVGDVIVFTAPDAGNRRVIHRVDHIYGERESAGLLGWRPDLLVMSTKGDDNPAADPWIVTLSDAVVWRQTGSLPHFGQLAIWLGDPIARFIAFAAIGAAVTAWAVAAVWRRRPEVAA